jgi:hypothetical protein
MKKRKLLYLNEENYKQLQMHCIILGTSVSKFIDELISKEIKKMKKGE